MIKGRSCKNPPYERMTDKKWDSLGKILTVKQALDLWWNSVRIRIYTNGSHENAITYKCDDGEYEVSELADLLDISEEEALKTKIILDESYFEDSDDNPIVYAMLYTPIKEALGL